MSRPLSIKSSQTKTSIPLVADKFMAPVRVVKIDYKEAEGEQKFAHLAVRLDLINPAPTTEGGTVPAGFPVFVTFPLGTAEEPTKMPEWSERNWSSFIDGVLGTGDAENKKGKPVRPDTTLELLPQLFGKVVVATFGVYKSKTNDQVYQSVNKYTFPGDLEG